MAKHFTFKEAEEVLGLSSNTIRLLVRTGAIRAFTTPRGNLRLDEESVRSYAEECKKPVEPTRPKMGISFPGKE